MLFLNKKVSRSFLKVKIELAWRISVGSSFHNVGAASANKRSPNVAELLIVGGKVPRQILSCSETEV